MGQPITVVEKPSPRPGMARFEINRSLTGMGHERYRSVDDIIDTRAVDELARRLFATGGVRSVHVYGSVVTVELAEGRTGASLVDVISGLHVHYPPGQAAPHSGNGVSASPGDAGGDEPGPSADVTVS
ncbi:MAG TPA: hypothetical protein VF743_13480 [Acidimicrobiales bacterium]